MTPTQVAGMGNSRVLLCSCGGAHTAALTESGALWTWGEGGWGQLGHSDGQDCVSPVQLERKMFGGARIAMVACGGGHTCAISEAGHLFSWGSGLWGQLANGARTDRLAPGLVDPALLAHAPCVLVACGANHTAVITVQGSSGHVAADDASARHGGSGGIGGGGTTLFTWGRGEDGRLGHNDAEDRLVPTPVRGAWQQEQEPAHTALRARQALGKVLSSVLSISTSRL